MKLNWYSRFSFRVLFIHFNFCDFKILDAFLSFLFSRNLKRWFGDLFVPLVYKYTFTYFVAMLLFVKTFRFSGVVVQGKRNTVKQKGTLAQTELSRYIFICDRNKKQKQSSLLFNFNITEICKETNKKLVHLGRTNFYLKVVQNTHFRAVARWFERPVYRFGATTMYLEDLVSQEMYKRVIVLEIYFRVSNKKIPE